MGCQGGIGGAGTVWGCRVGEDQQQGCGGGELLHVQRAQAEGNGSRDGVAPRTKQRAVQEPAGCVHRRRRE